MQTGVTNYEWTVPAGVWHEGFNRLAVIASHLASPARGRTVLRFTAARSRGQRSLTAPDGGASATSR